MRLLSYPRKDRRGRPLRIGHVVRIVGVPALKGMAPEGRKESLPVFRHLLGKYKKVVGFNELNEVEIFFRITRGRRRGMHFVWIEPHLVQIKTTRRPTRQA